MKILQVAVERVATRHYGGCERVNPGNRTSATAL